MTSKSDAQAAKAPEATSVAARFPTFDSPPPPVKAPLAPPAALNQYKTALDALQAPGLALSLRSAAHLTAQALVELGETKLAAMPTAEVTSWATSIKRRFPMVWSAVCRQDVRMMVNHMNISKIEHETWQDYELAVSRIVRSTEKPVKFLEGSKGAVTPAG